MAFLDIPEHTPEWHAQRLKMIGGSEIAALFDAQPDFADSKFALHYVKSGIVPAVHKASGRARMGTIFEPQIARMAAEARGWRIRKGRYATDDTTPGMGASIDYEIEDAGPDAEGAKVGPIMMDGDEIGRVYRADPGPFEGPGNLQIKQVDWLHHKKTWVADQPPDYIALQSQHEMACAGYKWGVVACHIGGNLLGVYFYRARPLVIDNIRARVTDFWQGVADKRPPQPDGSAGAATVLRALFPKTIDNEAAPLDLSHDNELPGICEDAASYSAQALAMKKLADDAKAKIKAKLGPHQFAFCTGWRIKIAVTPAIKSHLPEPGEMIGGRAESRKVTVTEDMRA